VTAKRSHSFVGDTGRRMLRAIDELTGAGEFCC
jgi:hypothetical protein